MTSAELDRDETLLTYCVVTATCVRNPGDTLKPRSRISGLSVGSCNSTCDTQRLHTSTDYTQQLMKEEEFIFHN